MRAAPLCLFLAFLAAAPAGHAAKVPDDGVQDKVAAKQGSPRRAGPGAATSKKVATAGKAAPKKVAASKKVAPKKAPQARAAPKKAKVGSGKATPKAAAQAQRARQSDLEHARAMLRAVKQDPAKRRYKHEWEKAIRALERAATGKDRAPALLDAARARYALYRFSSDESDRDLALALARKARSAGATGAATFIAAVRREAGDDRPQRASAPKSPTKRPSERSSTKAPPPATAPAADEGDGEHIDEPPETDPVLDRILAQLAEPGDKSAAVTEAVDGMTSGALAAVPPAAVPPAAIPPAAIPPAAMPVVEPPLAAVVPPTVRPADEGPRGPIRKIVIDPGHGGHDSGAIGPTRVREKDVVLAISQRVARKLRADGFEVVLTREDDRYLALAERTALANAHQGDLFVSIHANAHPRRDRQGVETWVLDVTGDRYSKRLAARENGILDDADSPLDVRRILADLDAKVSAQASRQLARVVQEELTSGIRERFGPVRDLGVKSALFYVLLGARMPAVLVETSFISNRAEEKRLKSPKFQEEVASGLARAINTFAAQQSRIAAR